MPSLPDSHSEGVMNAVSRPWVPLVVVIVLAATGVGGLLLVYHDWQNRRTGPSTGRSATQHSAPVAIAVSVDCSGMSTEDIEQQVAIPLEESLRAAPGANRVLTRVEDSHVRLTVRFPGIRDASVAAESVRRRLVVAAPSLPPRVQP